MNDKVKKAADSCREWYWAFRNKGKGDEQCVRELMDAADVIEALHADLITACTSGNPCLVCSHYKPERNGLEKCELNGWVCSWEWKGKQGWTQSTE